MVSVQDVDLFVDEIGAGVPLLMMHGLGLDHVSLRRFHDPLASVARLVFYDHRHNGRSGRTGPADHATWHADAIALLDQLNIGRAVLYGHSYGAWLALGCALRYPDRVSGLVLCGSSPAFDYVPDVIAAAQAKDPMLAAFLINGLSAPVESDEAFERLWRTILPLYFRGPVRPDILDGITFSARAFAAGMQCLQSFSVVDQLPSMKMPILLVNGAHDFITPAKQAKRIADGAPNARLVELTDSGHFPFAEQPVAYLTAIRDWLRSARPW